MDYPLFLFIMLILLALQDVLEAQCGMVQHNENLLWNSFMMLFNSLNEQPRVHVPRVGFPFKYHYWTLLIWTQLNFKLPIMLNSKPFPLDFPFGHLLSAILNY